MWGLVDFDKRIDSVPIVNEMLKNILTLTNLAKPVNIIDKPTNILYIDRLSSFLLAIHQREGIKKYGRIKLSKLHGIVLDFSWKVSVNRHQKKCMGK